MSLLLPNSIELSQEAQTELKQIMYEHIGDNIKNFTDEDLHHLGVFLLTLAAIAVHRKRKQKG